MCLLLLLRLSVCQPPAEAAAAARVSADGADGADGADIGADLDGIISPPGSVFSFPPAFYFLFFKSPPFFALFCGHRLKL